MFRRILLPTLLLAAGCATPVGVKRVGIDQAYRQINANAFTSRTLSDDTRAVLRRYGLSPLRGVALPAVAAIYAGMTIDSARRHALGRGGVWKGRSTAR